MKSERITINKFENTLTEYFDLKNSGTSETRILSDYYTLEEDYKNVIDDLTDVIIEKFNIIFITKNLLNSRHFDMSKLYEFKILNLYLNPKEEFKGISYVFNVSTKKELKSFIKCLETHTKKTGNEIILLLSTLKIE